MKKSSEFEVAVKLRMIELIRSELQKRKSFPDEIRLDKASVITDVKKFFDSHLDVVAATDGRIKETFGRRLAIALTYVGIDAYEMRSKAEKLIKKELKEKK